MAEHPPVRIRAALAAVQEGCILLVPHCHTDKGAVQWLVPGGSLRFEESLPQAAMREFEEETGLRAEILSLLDVSEVLLLDRPYHSITVTYLGRVVGGALRAEPNHPYGEKTPRWFTLIELGQLDIHPRQAIEKAFQPI